jgi:predicted nuclease with RNAse H fold
LRGNQLFVGLDPSAKSENSSGIGIISNTRNIHHIGTWKTFEELTQILNILKEKIVVIGIDGPLQPPAELDYCCFSDTQSECNHQQITPYKGRYCEFLLNRNGFRCFTTSVNSFAREWINRCFELNHYLTRLNYQTIEVYPTAARKILFPFLSGSKKNLDNRKRLQEALSQKGLKFNSFYSIYSDHELDALLAAYIAYLHQKGSTVSVGNRGDGFVILPKIKLKNTN